VLVYGGKFKESRPLRPLKWIMPTTSPFSADARWIRSPISGGPRVDPPVPYFRKAFSLPAVPVKATLQITALGAFECEINGQRIGDEVLAPGWTDYHKRVYYYTYDVTAQLAAGANAIGFLLGDGWYAGRTGGNDRQSYGDRPQGIAQLEITDAAGKVQRIVTDTSWKTTTGPILESDIMAGETYDARRELGAWSTEKYDDSAWQPALPAPDPAIAIERSPGPPVRRQEILAAHELKENRHAGTTRKIFDLEQNMTGRVRLSLRGDRGAVVYLRHAEMLDPTGALYVENLRGARATDCYVLKGEGVETWEPRFTFHGFRYVEISWGTAAKLAIEKVEGVVLYSDMPETGTFRCSNPLLNQLEHNIAWGQKGNFLDVPTDCPQRDERLGWTGDAQVFIRTAAFHRDVQGFFRKWLQDMRDAQGSNGVIPAIVPNNQAYALYPDGGPAWADAVFICAWTIYRCYDDAELLRDHYACMEGYMNYLAANKVRDGIRNHPGLPKWPGFGGDGFGDWLALDGSGLTDGGTPKDLIGTAFYAHAADLMARIAGVLGRQDDAKKYRGLHGEIVEAFRRRYVTPDGLLASGTQTSYVLALHFGLVPEAARKHATEELVRAIERNGWHLATGFVGTPYLLHVLEAQGRLDVAYRLLEQESFPSWLFPVKNGATTIWERWDGWTPEKGFQDKGMNSFNHYGYGCVGDWMVSTVAGLEIGAPGYKKILFKPRPGGTITWAEAKLRTPQGEASIRWELGDGSLAIDLLIPEGVEAELSLPEGWKAEAPKLAPGKQRVVAKKA
jgi:alpha-L-rhamnosidase